MVLKSDIADQIQELQSNLGVEITSKSGLMKLVKPKLEAMLDKLEDEAAKRFIDAADADGDGDIDATDVLTWWGRLKRWIMSLFGR